MTSWLDRVEIEAEVTKLRPDYTALLIVAEGLQPGPSDAASDALLRDAETAAGIAGRRERARERARAGAQRIRAGQIERDPRGGSCPTWCDLWTMCRRERP